MYTFEYNLEVSLSQFSDITSFLYSSSALQTVKFVFAWHTTSVWSFGLIFVLPIYILAHNIHLHLISSLKTLLVVFKHLFLFYVCAYLCTHVRVYTYSQDQENISDSLELELEAVISCPKEMLGTDH